MTVTMTADQLQMVIDTLETVHPTLRGITNSEQKMNFLRSCAGAELTKLWEELRVVFEAMDIKATREGEEPVPAHTYEQVEENTKLTLLKLVSKDRAIIDLLRMEQGR